MKGMICDRCGQGYTGRSDSLYCSLKCKRIAYRDIVDPQRPTKTDDRSFVCKATTGAAYELIVAADLMKMGYHVYRALSPACPVGDLVAIKAIPDRVYRILRIEVKTARRYANGKVVSALKSNQTFDVLAQVCHDGTITYTPEVTS